MKALFLAAVFLSLYTIGRSQTETVYRAENLGPAINSTTGELAPVISPDGRTLYFVRERFPGDDCNQAIWYSRLQADSTWGPAVRMGKPFNLENNNSINSVAADGNTLLIPNAYERGLYMGKGYSFTHRTKGGWSKFQTIGIKNYEQIAKGLIAFANLSADGNRIVMCISPSGSDTNNDLYVSFRQDDDTWSEPISMGQKLNTHYNEITPYLAPDGQTLYFSSNRPGGYGKYDIYMSRRLDNSFTNWSDPVNLGPEFNTEKSEAYYTLDARGEYAYLASTKDAIGAQDIVRVRLKKEVKPQPVVLIQGRVLDAKGQPVAAKIEYEVLPSGNKVGQVSSSPSDGSYSIVLPYGNNYGYTVRAEGQMPVSAHIGLTEVNEYKEIETSFRMVPIKKGEKIVLNNIFFAYNTDRLFPNSFPELDRMVQLMHDNSRMQVQIAGFTDDVGGSAYNQKLSEKRAQTIVNYLTSKGIAAERLSAVGYGEAQPLASNETAEGRAQNRRVEFQIVKK